MPHSYFYDKENFRYSDFSGYINEAKRRNKIMSSSRNMYGGDMWDHGRGYIGPLPVEDDNAGIIFANIRRQFTSRNIIAEVVDRQVDALLSKSPDWKIFDKKKVSDAPKNVRTVRAPKSNEPVAVSQTLNEEDQTENEKITEAEKVLSAIWLEAKLGDSMKESLTNFLVTGRGLLRIYISKEFEKKKEAGKIVTLEDAAKYIRIQAVDPGLGRVLDDDGEKLSIVEVGKKTKTTNKQVEISFVDEDDFTYVGTIDQSGAVKTEYNENEEVSDIIAKLREVADLSSPYQLKRRITTDEIYGDAFVTDSMLQNNRALNLNLSLGVGVLIESGYAEMVMTNVALETDTETDPADSAKTVKRPKGLLRGPGIINNLIGEQTTNAEGEVNFQQPSVMFKEPSPLTTFLQGESLYEMQILKEAKQIHVRLNNEADPSGESRIQSRQDHVKKSKKYKPTVDRHGSWACNTVLDLVASAADKDGYFSDIEVIFDSKIDAGELSAAEQDIVIARYEHDLISRETAMVLLGTEDPLVEIDLIRKDKEEKIEWQVKQLEATAKFGNMAENGQPNQSEKDRQKKEGQTKSVAKRN
jgi:hypothetical protein